MIQEAYGLHYEFIQQLGHFMVLSKTEGWKKEDVIQVELHMTGKQIIPHLLPLQLEETDGVVKLVYDVTSKRMLSPILKTEPFQPEELLEFLCRLTSILLESGNYLLREDSFLLDDRFMFVEKRVKELFLTYMPIRQHLLVPLNRQVHLFLESILQKSNLNNHPLFTPLLHYCGEEEFYLNGFKKLAEDLLEQTRSSPDARQSGGGLGEERLSQVFEQARNEKGSIPETKEDEATQSQIGAEGNREERDDCKNNCPRTSLSHGRDTELTFKPDPWGEQNHGTEAASWQDADKLLEEDSAYFSKRTVFLIYTAVAVIIILFWNIYLNKPEEALLSIAGGVTLFLPAAIYALLFWLAKREPEESEVWQPGIGTWENRKQENEWHVRDPSMDWNHAGYAVPDRVEAEKGNFFSKMKLSVSKKEKEIEPATSGNHVSYQTLEEHYASLGQMTTLLGAPKNDATLPLQSASNPFHRAAPHKKNNEKTPGLEVYKNGQRSVVVIEKDSFTVGRGEQGVDHREEQPGISRIHFEITRESGRFMVKDTGSSNGTFLNEEPLIPYQNYLLKQGDKIRVLQIEYIFFESIS